MESSKELDLPTKLWRELPFFHHFLVPTLLLTLCPPAVFLFWYIATHLDGSFLAFGALAQKIGVWPLLRDIASPIFFGSATAWKILAIFGSSQLLLMRLVPGKPFLGPVTPMGNVPVYKANGVSCFLLTICGFLVASFGLQWFSPTILYDELGPLLGALNLFSLLFCLFLYGKGIFRPSSSDHGISGNPLFDYYWGTELYPRLFGWDVKQFTNCRFGMMLWPLLLLSYAAKQQMVYGLSSAMVVSVGLQLLYIAKFFVWETGYFRSLDIMHDRAGFMICWGCLVWVPCIYTSPSLYLVHHPIDLGWFQASAIFLLGCASILCNFWADKQRQTVRATNGNCLIFGKKPILLRAPYQTEQGERKENLLLASGFWGIARHFHYIPELLGAFFWSLPALATGLYPYFYFLFLTVLLFDRASRHDRRCAAKYGKVWEEYCEKVPSKIFPML